MVRTPQVLSICKKNPTPFITCLVIYVTLPVNTIRETEIKPTLNTGHIASDQKPTYSHNFSAAVAIVGI